MKIHKLMLNSTLLMLATAGCASKTKLLDVPAVSMTKMNLAPGESLKEMGPATGKFCADSRNDSGTVGLMDEAIKDAQKQSNVDFITSAVFYSSGSCISVEGTGQTIVSAKK